MNGTTNRFLSVVCECAVRMVDLHHAYYGSEWPALTPIAGKIGRPAESCVACALR